MTYNYSDYYAYHFFRYIDSVQYTIILTMK